MPVAGFSAVTTLVMPTLGSFTVSCTVFEVLPSTVRLSASAAPLWSADVLATMPLNSSTTALGSAEPSLFDTAPRFTRRCPATLVSIAEMGTTKVG